MEKTVRAQEIEEQLKMIETQHTAIELYSSKITAKLDQANNAIGKIKSLLEDSRDKHRTNPLTVKELLNQIKQLELRHTDDTYKEVCFDFAGATPVGLISWRGGYNHLAITFNFKKKLSVSKFIEMLEESIGGVYEGYKGGLYTMNENTPLWVDNYGNFTQTGVFGVIDTGYLIVIETGWCEY